MKKLFTLSAMALASFSAFAQLPVSQQPGLKNAILEEFTGIKCTYCPDGHKIAAQIMAANPGRAFAVNIHTGSFATPSAGDPDFRTADGTAIAAIPGMGITGYPQGAVSRTAYPTTATALAMGRASWNQAVNTILAQPAYVNVAGQAELNVSTNQLTINIEAYYTASSPAATNKLTVMLLQNNINGPQTGAATFNPTMINPDGTYRHMHALRDVITTGATGESITTTTQGTLVQRTFNYTVPATYANVPVDLSNLELLAFVAESNTSIINVAKVPITLTGFIGVNNANLTSVTQPADLCDNNFAPIIQIKNMGSAPITQAVIDYNVNGGVNWSFFYYGSINPFSSSTITLPAISGFPFNASNVLNVNVTSVNGSSDDDPTNNNNFVNFNATNSVSQTLNLTLNVLQDQYGDEVTWKFFDKVGNQVASGGPYNQLPSTWNGTGTWASGSNTVSLTIAATTPSIFINSSLTGTGIPTTPVTKITGQISGLPGQSGVYTINTVTTLASNNSSANGTNPNASLTLLNTSSVNLPSSGCYRFVIYDAYGDGINSGYGAGNVTILDGNNNTVYFNNGVYTSQASRNFYGNTALGISDGTLESSLNIFPNPASNTATVQFSLSNEESVSINLLNAVGQSVMQQQLGTLAARTHNQTLDVTSLSNGLYFVEIKAGNSTVTRKFSVAK